MKIKQIVIIALLMLGAVFFSTGCQNLGGWTVNQLYGRSGVFVTNNYAGYTLVVSCSNGQRVSIRTGETMQFLTAGFINGDDMLMTAMFYGPSGKYAGYDETKVRVWYGQGGTFVRTWDPYFRPLIQ